MYEMLKEFIKPELLVMIPVLYLLGMALKASSVADKKIPMVLGIVSITLSVLFIVTTSDFKGWQDVLMSIFVGITQGILCVGARVYVNQVIKQSKKEELINNKTIKKANKKIKDLEKQKSSNDSNYNE